MPKIYHAPKPRHRNREWLLFIALRVIFPPILLWDLIKLGANKLLGEWVGHLVLPAQNGHFDALAIFDSHVDHFNRRNRKNLLGEKHHIITHDGALLDTLEIKHSSQEQQAPHHQKYIIHLTGNGMCYENNIGDMKKDATALKASVVGFNFRGVGQSKIKPRSKKNLVTDGIAQVQRLLDKGVPPHNITLKGFSLGAGIATLIARHFHKLEQPIHLFNNRSFSSITNFLVGHIRQLKRDESGWIASGHKESRGGIILGWLAKPIIKFAVTIVQWEINAGSAFKSIPEEYKEYIVLRSRKEIRNDRIDDMIIPYYASMHYALTFERHKKKAAIDKEIKNIDCTIPKSAPIVKLALTHTRKSLVQARENIKSDRKMEADNPHINAHLAYDDALHNRSGKSAQAFFIEFVQKAETNHAGQYTPARMT